MADKNGIRAVIEVVDRVTAPVRRIGAGISAMVRSLNLDATREQIGRVVTGFTEVTKAAALMAAKIVASSTAIGAALMAITRGVAETTQAAITSARSVNVTLQGWQRFGHAATLVGSSAEQMGSALGSLRDRALDAARGNSELRVAFRRMGVALVDSRGQLRPTEALMADVADAFARVPDSARRTAAAVALFGEAGVGLIPMLAQGSAGLRRAAEDARFLGLVMTDAEAGALTDFGTSLRRLRGALDGVQNAIAVRLAPVITPLVTAWTNWIAANRELIATRIEEYIRAIPDVLQSLSDQASTLWGVLRPIVATFGDWVSWFGPLNSAAVALGLYLGGGLLASVVRLTASIAGPAIGAIGTFISVLRTGTGVMAAFNAVLLANPVGLVIAGIVLIGAAAYLLWRYWKDIPGLFRAMWGRVRELFSGFGDWVGGAFPAIMETAVTIITTVWGVLRTWFNTLWNFWVREPFNAFITWLDGWTGGAVTAAVGRITDAWRALGGFFGDLWPGIQANFAAFITWLDGWTGGAATAAVARIMDAWRALGGFFGDLWPGIQANFAAFITWLDGWTGGAATAAVARIMDAWRALGAFLVDLWAGIQATFDAVWGPILAGLNRLDALFQRNPRTPGGPGDPPADGPRRGTLGGRSRASGFYAPDVDGPPVPPVQGGGAQRVDAGGQIEVTVTDDRVAVTRVESNDPRIRIQAGTDTGRYMATP
ncbi:hypothetical protein ACQW02_25505 [Humitalea sp. 24SJ18S-53]|uniref:hypothetical protein n=1 Tax=Humitalea sp. 24SJ18S-53 TaxID=3422307 RepID=UPI003D67B1C7